MKYFTLEELTNSATAKRRGINNTPDESSRKNLIALVENILDPLREAWGAPIIVTSGYRCGRLNKAVSGAAKSQHCFDAKTEVLTESGWKTYDVIEEDDMVFSYNIGSDKIELVPIDSIIKRAHKGRMMHMTSTCIDVMVTDKHRMLVRYPIHKYKRKSTHNISPEGQAYFDSLKTENHKYHIELAQEVFGKRRIYKCAGTFDGAPAYNLDFLKFVMAFVCDGYWCKKNTTLSMGFRFKKTRKVEHLIKLADKLGWRYALHKDKNGVYNFHFRNEYALEVFYVVGENKMLPLWLMTLNNEDALELFKCYAAYDGCFDTRDSKERMSLCTTVKNNANVLQAMCVLSGLKCQMRTFGESTYSIKGKTGIAKEHYVLTTCKKTETKASEGSYVWEDYDGVVWCANNRNTTLVTRRNGKVSIQGNCFGQAADIRTVSDKPSENKKLFDKIRELKLPYDQLIDEYGYNWVHVSYSSRHRRQILHIK